MMHKKIVVLLDALLPARCHGRGGGGAISGGGGGHAA